MYSRRVTVVAISLMLCAVVSTASRAQSKKRPSQPHRSSAAKNTEAIARPEQPFDDALAKLPAAFAGTSIEWVLKNRTIASKGEFETTAEYNERIENFRANVYAFVPNEPQNFEYDADAELFSAKIYPGITDVESKPGWYFRSFDVRRTKVSESTYVGTNAFGTKVVVTKTKWKLTQVVVDDTNDILGHSFDPIAISFSLPRDRARSVKPNLRIAFICSPKPEQFQPAKVTDVPHATGYDIGDATIESPTERWTYYLALRANLRQIWVFDHATGEVYGRFFPNGRPIGAPILGDSATEEKHNDKEVAGNVSWPLESAGDMEPLRIGGDVKAPVILTRVEPMYPEVAARARISGVVIIECVVNRNGEASRIQVLKPLPFGLDQAAVDAVKQWTFKPGTLHGRAVDVIFNVTVKFDLPASK